MIKEVSLQAIILIISNHTERSITIQTIQNGASGYLLKKAHWVNQMQASPQLIRREKQALILLAEGKTSQVIAWELFGSPLAASTHRRNLMQKFNAKNTTELIMAASNLYLLK